MKKFLLVVAFALTACRGNDSSKADSALAADLALASQMQTAQPQFKDTSPTVAQNQRAPQRIESAPRTRITPRPPAAPAGETEATASARVIGPGSSFSLASQQRICTSSNRPGDRFVATLTNPVTGTNGAVIPAGSSVVLEVVALAPGTNGTDGTVRLSVHSVEFNGRSYPVSGEVYTTTDLERTRVMTDPNADKKKVIGGAVAGAILGRVIGKSTKGTVIGAAAGAATGAAAAKATQSFEGCLPVGGGVRLTLSEALVLQ
jgi:hypothetical protein